MAMSRRSGGARFQNAIWPGFVDAMTGLLLVLMFVLTIFMVIQFVLRETITGQESELNLLNETVSDQELQLSQFASEVLSLTSALGLEQDRANTLSTDLDAATAQISAQASRIVSLTTERDEQADALSVAQSRITNFETQVAGLLADRDDANARIAGLEEEEQRLLSEAEALNLALAGARDEIDLQAEQARLAAARRDALAAMVSDLETTAEADAARIAALETETANQTEALTEAEAARLAEAAAAEALRNRLENADTELTAMTLALEEKRREAEETLTLLAAADSAREGLDRELAALLLVRATLEEDRETLLAQIAETEDIQETANLSLESVQAELATALTENATLDAQVAALESQIATLTDGNADTAARQADLEAQLAAALAAMQIAEDAVNSGGSEADRQAALLAEANAALSEQEALSAESQRQVALMNAQISELRDQVGTLQGLLKLAEDADVESNIQIEALGSQLNTALARVAAEESRARALEEAESARLAAEAERLRLEAEAAKADVQNLEQFRSDFFGQLRQILEGQDRVRIEGDRFVFSSEVLFQPGQAELSGQGRDEIANIAGILSEIADDIPEGIDWVIRVDGHTDNLPLGGNGRYRDNWELSQGRALSVVRFMSESLGIPPNRLAANGFGEYQPINRADTAEARAQNRRIELKLTER